MKDREPRLKTLMLSPGVSIIMALAGAAGMLMHHDTWLSVTLSAVVCMSAVYEIKARALYKGPNFPFAGLFMLLQAAIVAGVTGMMAASVAAVSLVLLFHCFSRPGKTKTIYLIYLLCGLGALGSRCFALLSAALMLSVVLVRAFSVRGLVAAMLGLITPFIIGTGFGIYDPMKIVDIYAAPWIPGIDASTLLACSVALVFGLATFLQSYGYPAKARARNMSILGFTALAVFMPLVDSANSFNYLPMVNLCGAYNASHFAATRRHGWIWAVITCIAAILFYFLYR